METFLQSIAGVLLGSLYVLWVMWRQREHYLARGWDEGYWLGVADERTATDLAIGYGPGRVNPYGDPRERYRPQGQGRTTRLIDQIDQIDLIPRHRAHHRADRAFGRDPKERR